MGGVNKHTESESNAPTPAAAAAAEAAVDEDEDAPSESLCCSSLLAREIALINRLLAVGSVGRSECCSEACDATDTCTVNAADTGILDPL